MSVHEAPPSASSSITPQSPRTGSAQHPSKLPKGRKPTLQLRLQHSLLGPHASPGEGHVIATPPDPPVAPPVPPTPPVPPEAPPTPVPPVPLAPVPPVAPVPAVPPAPDAPPVPAAPLLPEAPLSPPTPPVPPALASLDASTPPSFAVPPTLDPPVLCPAVPDAPPAPVAPALAAAPGGSSSVSWTVLAQQSDPQPTSNAQESHTPRARCHMFSIVGAWAGPHKRASDPSRVRRHRSRRGPWSVVPENRRSETFMSKPRPMRIVMTEEPP